MCGSECPQKFTLFRGNVNYKHVYLGIKSISGTGEQANIHGIDKNGGIYGEVENSSPERGKLIGKIVPVDSNTQRKESIEGLHVDKRRKDTDENSRSRPPLVIVNYDSHSFVPPPPPNPPPDDIIPVHTNQNQTNAERPISSKSANLPPHNPPNAFLIPSHSNQPPKILLNLPSNSISQVQHESARNLHLQAQHPKNQSQINVSVNIRVMPHIDDSDDSSQDSLLEHQHNFNMRQLSLSQAHNAHNIMMNMGSQKSVINVKAYEPKELPPPVLPVDQNINKKLGTAANPEFMRGEESSSSSDDSSMDMVTSKGGYTTATATAKDTPTATIKDGRFINLNRDLNDPEFEDKPTTKDMDMSEHQHVMVKNNHNNKDSDKDDGHVHNNNDQENDQNQSDMDVISIAMIQTEKMNGVAMDGDVSPMTINSQQREELKRSHLRNLLSQAKRDDIVQGDSETGANSYRSSIDSNIKSKHSSNQSMGQVAVIVEEDEDKEDGDSHDSDNEVINKDDHVMVQQMKQTSMGEVEAQKQSQQNEPNNNNNKSVEVQYNSDHNNNEIINIKHHGSVIIKHNNINVIALEEEEGDLELNEYEQLQEQDYEDEDDDDDMDILDDLDDEAVIDDEMQNYMITPGM